MNILRFLFIYLFVLSAWISAEAIDKEASSKNARGVIFLQPNTTQLFTELYQAYGFLSLPKRTFFEDALYLDQSNPPHLIPMQPSNQAIFEHASQVLSEFHKRVNDLELYIDPDKPKPFFYTAAGSKHLIVALVYGIVMSEPNKKFLFVEEAPYYSGHPSAVSGIFHYPNARFLAFHEASEVKPEAGEVLVEFVTSPNNPDGKFRKPLTEASIIIADFVFASSAFGNDGSGYLDKNIEWVRAARAQGKHVFSFNSASKQFGKTGARCGYIWYPTYDSYAASIFNKFFSFISASTVAGGTTGLADFLNLIKAFLETPDSGKSLREDCRKSLMKRHVIAEREILNRYPDSKILSIPGSPTFFAKIHDPRIPNKKASDVIFEDLDVVVNNGEPMGETNDFVRLNLCGYSQILTEFFNRLAKQPKYKVEDVLVASAKVCNHSTICSSESQKTRYLVSPGDCFLDADALKGSIEIAFPAFIDYEKSQEIIVKKIDASENPVVIKTDTFTRSLKASGETVKLQWTQPFYLNGHWQVID